MRGKVHQVSQCNVEGNVTVLVSFMLTLWEAPKNDQESVVDSLCSLNKALKQKVPPGSFQHGAFALSRTAVSV